MEGHDCDRKCQCSLVSDRCLNGFSNSTENLWRSLNELDQAINKVNCFVMGGRRMVSQNRRENKLYLQVKIDTHQE